MAKSSKKSTIKKQKIYNPFTKKTRSINPLGDTAKRIYKYQIEKEGLSAVAILPQNLTYDVESKKVIPIRRIVDSSGVERLTYDKFKADGGADTLSYLRQKIKRYGGKSVRIVMRYTLYNETKEIDEQFQAT